ncbi:MAG: DNA mismatch repair endonuclease MutL, partial [Clostridiales Family XIII bacterium]|nr:DNA mismatch repair endonuclease MutL [Clostridiales Family XIII bacterium]
MEKILELPPHIAEKIAAGEVVTGPASVVKELIENSLDAGARAITVEIRNGGKSLIRVSDDGAGIPAEQVRTAFLRHATSKLRHLSDLSRINTLGFRGEALTSIAAVSRLELYTKTAEAKAGAMIRIEGGEVTGEKPVGAEKGTTVVVTDLFFNTPARLKFLKSDRAEGARVIDAVSVLALSRADVKVRLIAGDAILFSTPGRGDLLANILTIYGNAPGKDLLPLRAEDGNLAVHGFVASPAARRAARRQHIFFINDRSVRSRLMEKALAEGCAETPLAAAGCPFALLFLRVPPERLDVNIHPAKSEVRFDDEAALSSFLADAIRAAVRTKEAIPTIPPRGKSFAPADAGDDDAPAAPARLAFAGTLETDKVDIKNLLSTIKEKDTEVRANLLMEDAEEGAFYAEERAPAPFDIAAIAPMGRIFGTYIVGRDDAGFYFIDQHAAHERVLYERFLRQHQNREKLCQQLLAPLVVELPHTARAATADDGANARAFLAALGYEAEDFGAHACRINAVPAFLSLSEAEDFLNRLLDALPEGRPPEDEAAIDRVISAACKAAVKAGDKLGDAEVSALLASLAACENPYACPHGRPVFIRLTERDIER